MCMIPDKLKPGDEVRIVAPARSASDISKVTLRRAQSTLESVENGASEIDMVINIGALKDGRDNFVADDIRSVVNEAK